MRIGELLVDRDDLDRVAAHPERAAGEGEVVAGVLHLDEPAQQVVALDLVADPEPGHPVDVLLRGAEAVDAGHGGDDDDVAPGQQASWSRECRSRSTSSLIERVLLDVGVGLRDVGLGLVVVVVARRSTRRRCWAAARGTRWRAGRRASCWAPSRGSAAAPARSARPSSPTCRCRWRRAARCRCSPARTRRASSAIAVGWSPLGRVLGDHLEGCHRALEVGRGTHGSTVRRTTDSAHSPTPPRRGRGAARWCRPAPRTSRRAPRPAHGRPRRAGRTRRGAPWTRRTVRRS